MSQVAHQAGAYPSVCSMMLLEVFLLPPGRDVSPLQGYPHHYVHWYPCIHLGGERHCESNVPKNTTQCPWPELEPGPHDPEANIHV